MPDPSYELPELAVLYDALNDWRVDIAYYLALPGKRSQTILDLGCGTGLLSAGYAKAGHKVTGADPAQAMLDIARTRPDGDKVNWVSATAQSFCSQARFDLITMTGHAFQTLIGDSEIRATLKNIKTHLVKGGVAVFESRNPAIDWLSRWALSTDLETSLGMVREEREFLSWEGERMIFDQTYHFAEKSIVSRSVLRFADLKTLTHLIHESGLEIRFLQGDWDGQAFDPATSPEMIFGVSVKEA